MYLSLSLSLSLYLSLSLSFCWSGHVPSSLWSNVKNVTSLQGRSLKVLSKCICLVIVFVFVFVIVIFWVRSCPLITLVNCLKGHKCLGSLSERVLYMRLSSSLSLSLYLSLSLSLHSNLPMCLCWGRTGWQLAPRHPPPKSFTNLQLI